jgi:hypothetical protein
MPRYGGDPDDRGLLGGVLVGWLLIGDISRIITLNVTYYRLSAASRQRGNPLKAEASVPTS